MFPADHAVSSRSLRARMCKRATNSRISLFSFLSTQYSILNTFYSILHFSQGPQISSCSSFSLCVLCVRRATNPRIFLFSLLRTQYSILFTQFFISRKGRKAFAKAANLKFTTHKKFPADHADLRRSLRARVWKKSHEFTNHSFFNTEYLILITQLLHFP